MSVYSAFQKETTYSSALVKPKSLCFTGEAGCLVYPNYRYCSLLRPALVTGKRLNYLPTAEGRKREEERSTERGSSYTGRDFYVVFWGGVLNKARLMIHGH